VVVPEELLNHVMTVTGEPPEALIRAEIVYFETTAGGAVFSTGSEGWTVLSALAAMTSRIRLATLATSVGYRNPAHLAKITASVDLISRGRLTLGIGAGYGGREKDDRRGRGARRRQYVLEHPRDVVVIAIVGQTAAEGDRLCLTICGSPPMLHASAKRATARNVSCSPPPAIIPRKVLPCRGRDPRAEAGPKATSAGHTTRIRTVAGSAIRACVGRC
jgi:hypothetical protein